LLGEDVYLGLSKAERLTYGDSMMTHAMVFTGVTNDVKTFKNTKGVIQRSKTYDIVIAEPEKSPLLTPKKLKSDCKLKSYEHIKTSAAAICPIL
jgi:hypothetical protein